MRKYSSRSRESLASSRTSAAMLPPPFRRHSRHGNGAAPLCEPAGRSGVSRGAAGQEQRTRGRRERRGAGAVRDRKHGAGCGRARAAVRTERGRDEMVAAAFLPQPRPLPGSHHGGLRSSAGRPRPPRPALAASPRPRGGSPRLSLCEAAPASLGSGRGRRRVHVPGRRAQPDPSSGSEEELVRPGRGRRGRRLGGRGSAEGEPSQCRVRGSAMGLGCLGLCPASAGICFSPWHACRTPHLSL